MDSANINDPTAVRALLDRLRASQAWQDTLNSSTSHSVDSEHLGEVRERHARTPKSVQGEPISVAVPPASVATLLSQLRTPEWTSVAISTPSVSDAHVARQSSPDVPRPSSEELPPTQPEQPAPRLDAATSSTRVQDVRSISFQQALPHLTELASDPGFLANISRLQQEQNELERKLWEERQAIQKKHEERVKVARTKATLISAGLSKHEADMINDAYRRDMQKFNRERVLLAWDALIQKQQAALEALGVPTMFPTTSQVDCQKQRRVIQVLEGL